MAKEIDVNKQVYTTASAPPYLQGKMPGGGSSAKSGGEKKVSDSVEKMGGKKEYK
jgi:hypothetical protein